MDQKQDRCDVKIPMDSQVSHLGAEEGISRFCSLHLHELLAAASVKEKGVKRSKSNEITIIVKPLAYHASSSCVACK